MIINRTKNKVISAQELIADTFWSRVRGLMFRSRKNVVMVFPKEQKVSLHMVGVFFPIDVLMVDASGRIVEIRRDFRPFQFWSSTRQGKYVIEMAEKGEYDVDDMIEIRGTPAVETTR